jgi:putative oxidoreductase
MSTVIASLLRPSAGPASRAALLVRAPVGGVFITSGVVKYLYDNQGPGRFAKLGLPGAADLAHFVGAVEIVGGCLIAIGLFVRLAAIPLVIDMLVAIATTKVPLLFGPGPEPVAAMPKVGFWAFAYQSRLDWTMLAACLYLGLAGAGLWSLDALLARRRRAAPSTATTTATTARHEAAST